MGRHKKQRRESPAPPVKVIFSVDSHMQELMDKKVKERPRLRSQAFLGGSRMPACERLLRDALEIFEQRGIFFHHSVPMFGYIADFYCPEKKVVIELDGPFHQYPGRPHHDRIRDAEFKKNGIRTLRYLSCQVHQNLPLLLQLLANDLKVEPISHL